MDLRSAVLLAGAGLVAGAVNTLAGAGSLLTFPALLGIGLSPLVANVSNCIGLVPGSLSGAYGMRARLVGQRDELLRRGAFAAVGSLVGAVLLLTLPGGAFDRVVPVLVALAGLLVLLQPLVVRLTGQEEKDGREQDGPASAATGPAMGAVAVYSGYFGAAQGVMMLGVLGVLAPRPLVTLNAQKNVLAVVANGVAGLVYALVAPVDWTAVAVLALGSVCGGPVGAALAGRVRPGPLRVAVAAVALGVAARLALSAW